MSKNTKVLKLVKKIGSVGVKITYSVCVSIGILLCVGFQILCILGEKSCKRV